jgi:tRNA nucleotidyltransferase/poly(A) polymerase
MTPAPVPADLPAPLRVAAACIARALRGRGHEAWIVGGAVRDLALGRAPKDVDIATDALPDEVESLFPRTSAVGKAFGTILVHLDASALRAEGLEVEGGLDVEVTTFRSDGAYEDARRPTEVRYGHSPEEDARRRDFTCNALYLDPLDGGFLDPTGGLEDLAQRRLRCVGDPAERFVEDGLRLLRLVRFEARFDLTPTGPTLAAARAAREALRGVSAERVRAELAGMMEGPDPARAVRRLLELELGELALPGFAALDGGDAGRLGARLAGLERAGSEPGLVLGLALLCDPDPRLTGEDLPGARDAAEGLLEHLRLSRRDRRGVLALWGDADRLRALLGAEGTRRSQRVRLVREERWPELLRLARARLGGEERGAERARLEALEEERASSSTEELYPTPLVDSGLLAEAGVPRGPGWALLLEEAEALQLDGELADGEAARRWLAGRAGSEGGA